MPSTSKAQQQASGIAHAVAEGKLPKSKLRGASKQMFESMKRSDLSEFAHTKTKILPERVGRSEHNSPEVMVIEHKAPGAHKKIINVQLG